MRPGERDRRALRGGAHRISQAADYHLMQLQAHHTRALMRGHQLLARRLAEEIRLAELHVNNSESRHAALLLDLEGSP